MGTIIIIHCANFLSFRQERTRKRDREFRVAALAGRNRHISVLNVKRDFVIVHQTRGMAGSVLSNMCHHVRVHDYWDKDEYFIISLLYI